MLLVVVLLLVLLLLLLLLPCSTSAGLGCSRGLLRRRDKLSMSSLQPESSQLLLAVMLSVCMCVVCKRRGGWVRNGMDTVLAVCFVVVREMRRKREEARFPAARRNRGNGASCLERRELWWLAVCVCEVKKRCLRVYEWGRAGVGFVDEAGSKTRTQNSFIVHAQDRLAKKEDDEKRTREKKGGREARGSSR